MNSKVFHVRIFLALTVCAVVVLYFSLNSYTRPGKVVAPTFPLACVLTQPKEKKMSSHKHKTSHAHYGTLPPFPEDLPYPVLLKPASSIRKALWTSQLYQFLNSLNHSISPHVNMVFGDSNHLELILNWIIAAHVRLNPPLHNIMVISIDRPLCDFLASKKVPVTCIAVPAESILASTGSKLYEKGIKSRLLVLRLINFWGYDVASYDSDAVLLRNPQHFFNSNPDVEFFAAPATLPTDVSNLWGFAVCGGSVIVRSHHSTENLWKAIHHGSRKDGEQFLWNHALQSLGMRWNVTTGIGELCGVQTGWQSYGPLASIVFPQNVFCRKCCTAEHTSKYYLIHLNVIHSMIARKIHKLKEMNSWFLLDHWKDSVDPTLEGNLWLMSIYAA